MAMKQHIRNGKAVQRIEGIDYNDAPRVIRMVFVCGLHRSGTSLLEQSLVAELELSCLRMNVSENEGQHAQTVYSPAIRFGGPGRFAFSEDMQRELSSLSDFAAHGKALIADWAPFVAGSSPVLIEKSPPNLTKIWWLRRVFPGASFIVLVRDPRAVSAATQRWSNASLEELMMHWNVAHSLALRDMRPEDCITVRYEDFVASPGSAVDRIAKFLRCERRARALPIAGRYQELVNSNDKYIAMHSCRFYGKGAWDDFGYRWNQT